MSLASGHLHEHVWQFKLTDGKTAYCAAYFEKRASEMASALNCRLVAMSVMGVRPLLDDARMVVGTALLENPRENVLEFRRPRHRR